MVDVLGLLGETLAKKLQLECLGILDGIVEVILEEVERFLSISARHKDSICRVFPISEELKSQAWN